MKKNLSYPRLIIFGLAFFVVSLAIGLGLQIVIAAWTGPTGTPPNNNVAAPINIGVTAQTKTGRLELQNGLMIHGPGTASSLITSTSSGISIDANNSGTGDVFVYETGLYMGSGKNIYLNNSDVYVNGSRGVNGQVLTETASGAQWQDVTGGTIGGSGTASYIPKWTASSTLGNSQIFDNATNVGIGIASPAQKLTVAGIVAPSADNTYDLGGGATSAWRNLYLDTNIYAGGAIGTNGQILTQTASGARWQNATGGTIGGSGVAGQTAFFTASSTLASDANFVWDNTNKRLGIGTASPAQKLTVAGVVAPSANNTYDLGASAIAWRDLYFGRDIYANGSSGTTGQVLTKTASGAQWQNVTGITGSGSGNYLSKWITSSALTSSQIYDNGTYVGIGTASPAQKLTVAGVVAPSADNTYDLGGGATSAWRNLYLDTNIYAGGAIGTNGQILTQTASGARWQNAATGQNLSQVLAVGNSAGSYSINMNSQNITNVNKITVNVVDPLYNINGEKFATYGLSSTGIKEETTGNLTLKCDTKNCSAIIDFAKTEKGSDLWLFYQITDFGKDWGNLVVLLTPQGKQDAWYEVNPIKHQLSIYGEKASQVSYRLTAPRFDAEKWINASSDKSAEGIKVEPK